MCFDTPWQQFCLFTYCSLEYTKEEYEVLKYVLEKIGHDQHKWLISVDLKMVNFLLGQQTGFTKYSCFLCMCDRRDRAQPYKKKKWPAWEELMPWKEKKRHQWPSGEQVQNTPLHIKLFTKPLDTNDNCFSYLWQVFLRLTMGNLKAGICDY